MLAEGVYRPLICRIVNVMNAMQLVGEVMDRCFRASLKSGLSPVFIDWIIGGHARVGCHLLMGKPFVLGRPICTRHKDRDFDISPFHGQIKTKLFTKSVDCFRQLGIEHPDIEGAANASIAAGASLGDLVECLLLGGSFCKFSA